MRTQEHTLLACVLPSAPARRKFLTWLGTFVRAHKILVTTVTMIISAFSYVPFFGIRLSVVLVMLLLVHELGHVVALRFKGFESTSPIFVPFLGAFVSFTPPENRDGEAFVAYGGPFWGGVIALVLFGVYYLIPAHIRFAHIVLTVSYVGVLINLFNLLPVEPLDGGFITQAVGHWCKYLGFVVLTALTAIVQSPVMLFIWILVVMSATMISARLRALFSTALWIAMVILMIVMSEDAPTALKWITCLAALPFVGCSIKEGCGPQVAPEKDSRPMPTMRRRVLWLVLYVGLTGTLFLVAVLQRRYLLS